MRRPPRDPFNAALSFGYSLLYRDVLAASICVGLEPAIGFFHRPRSAAHPLALNIMELFRTTLWDMDDRFDQPQGPKSTLCGRPQRCGCRTRGRRQAIKLYETRKQEEWQHPVLNIPQLFARHRA